MFPSSAGSEPICRYRSESSGYGGSGADLIEDQIGDRCHKATYASNTTCKYISIASSTRSISSHVEFAKIGVARPSLCMMSHSAINCTRHPVDCSRTSSISCDTNPKYSSTRESWSVSIKFNKFWDRVCIDASSSDGFRCIRSLKQKPPKHRGRFVFGDLRFGTFVPHIERFTRSSTVASPARLPG